MKRTHLKYWLTLIGICLILPLFVTSPGDVKAGNDNEYIGSRECAACHRDIRNDHKLSRHVLTLQSTGDETTVILGDFTQNAELLNLKLPDEASSRILSADDIAYTLGTGRYVQRYLYETSDGVLIVLPIEWNVEKQIWQQFTQQSAWPSDAYNWDKSCAGCHTTGYDIESTKWVELGVQCEACHGPGALHADSAEEFREPMTNEEIIEVQSLINPGIDPEICGQCHSQGTSLNGTRPYPVGYIPGQVELSETFQLVDTIDPARWWNSGHAKQSNMQYNEWLLSSHSTSLPAVKQSPDVNDTCLSCHSADYRRAVQLATRDVSDRPFEEPELNRLTYELLLQAYLPDTTSFPSDTSTAMMTTQHSITCVTCHNPHSASDQEFYLVEESETLCNNCHSNGGLQVVHYPAVEMYQGQELIAEIQGVSTSHFELESGPSCVTCHMTRTPVGNTTRVPHTFKPIMPGEASFDQIDSCSTCHTDLTDKYLADSINKTQDKVANRLNTATTVLNNSDSAPEWISSALRFIDQDGSLGIHNRRYTEALLDAVERNLGLAEHDPTGLVIRRKIENPTDCAECHVDEHRKWQNSSHANASLNSRFQQAFAENGRTKYCLRCHTSGFDSSTGQYIFEGVVCSNCHLLNEHVPHPPGPIDVANDSTICGYCHSGGHASTYDEWLLSQHSDAGIDCVDCHASHSNGLKLTDVNSTCSDCHAEAMNDEIHMGAEMTCTDCHMTPRNNDDTLMISHTGHSMDIDPSVCADCHGNTHSLTVAESNRTEEEIALISSLEHEVSDLKTAADENLSSGIVGGAIGALILLGLVFVLLRLLGRIR